MKPTLETLFARTILQRVRLRLIDLCREIAGRALEALHVPASLREFEYVDPLTNETIYLATGTRYSVLHVGGKRFFFSRATGRFDGTSTSLELNVVKRTELFD